MLLCGVLSDRIRPGVIARFAQPGIGGLYGLERRVRRAALWADRQFVRRRCFEFLLLVEDVLRNGLGSNELSLIELVGSDQNAWAAQSRAAQLSTQVSDLASALASLGTGRPVPNPAPSQPAPTG